MAGLQGIRSDYLRALAREAVRQGWSIEWGKRHPELVCPVCGHRETITCTGKQQLHESRNKATRLRRHGLLWKGRGGVHVPVQRSH